jgi:hypothetical protein
MVKSIAAASAQVNETPLLPVRLPVQTGTQTGATTAEITLTVTLTGGASIPNAAESGWIVVGNQATRRVAVPSDTIESVVVSVTVSCPATGRFIISSQVEGASISSTVDVLDALAVTLDAASILHPTEVWPGGPIAVEGLARNMGDAPVFGAWLRVAVGNETRDELRDLNGRETWRFTQTFTAPMSLGAIVPISITAVGASYEGQVAVVGPQFEVASVCDPIEVAVSQRAVCRYTITNTGTRAGDLMAQVNWPSGVQLSVDSVSGGATATVNGQTIAIAQASLPVGGQGVVVASVTPIVTGIYRPTWSVTPGWAMAASGALAGIHTPQGASQHRVFLPVVLR